MEQRRKRRNRDERDRVKTRRDENDEGETKAMDDRRERWRRDE